MLKVLAALAAAAVMFGSRRAGAASRQVTDEAPASAPPSSQLPRTPATEPAARPVPYGLGAFIGGLAQADSVEDMRKVIRQHGVRWVCVLVVWQNPDGKHTRWNTGREVTAYLDMLKAEGVGLYLWAWPEWGHEDALIAEVINRAEEWAAWNPLGIVIDPEDPYYNKPGRKDRGPRAEYLAERLAAECWPRGLATGVTSYGLATWHPGFRWHAFVPWADFGLCQSYDGENQFGPNYPKACWESWVRLGFRHVCAGFAFFNKTPAQLQAWCDNAPQQTPAIWGWQWRQATAEKWAVVGQYAAGKWGPAA